MAVAEAVLMLYLSAPNQRPRDYDPMNQWGQSTIFLEIGDDFYAVREIEVFENGHVLRYDRTHWVDDFGMLGDMRYDAKKWEKWWGPAVAIDPAEFEEQWRRADGSPMWPMQLNRAKMLVMGSVPVWLRRPQNPRES